MDEPPDLDESFAVEPIRRAAALRRLADGPAQRGELEAELDVSKATLHRIVKEFAEIGLVRETDEGVALSGAGKEATAAVGRYLERMQLIDRLEPLLNGLPEDIAFDIGAFADAEVVTPSPGQPQRPVQRIVDFIEAAPSLRATAAVVLPIYVEVLSREVLAGMETELVVSPAVIDALREEYPDRFARALERDSFQVIVYDGIEVGVAIDGERALVVGTRDGLTRVVVVSERSAAVDWAESVYEQYREAGATFDLDS